MDLNTIKSDITNTFFTDFTTYTLPQDNYTDFAYPKFIKLMKFHTDRFEVTEFGSFMTMHNMIIESIKAYSLEISKAEASIDNLKGLSSFRGRMISEGNPSSSVLEKVFGKDGAADFFRSCVMPMHTV